MVSFQNQSKVVSSHFVSMFRFLIHDICLLVLFSAMSSRIRKYPSGSEKRKQKQKTEEFTRSQKGALDKFLAKKSNVSSENQSADACPDEIHGSDSTNVETHAGDINVDTNMDLVHGESTNPAGEANRGDDIAANVNVSLQPDIFDPRNWGALDPKAIDVLVEKGPKRDLSIQKGPKDKFGRRFSAMLYTRVLSNGEECDRD